MGKRIAEEHRPRTTVYLLLANGVFVATLAIWLGITGDVHGFLDLLGVGHSVPVLGWILAVAVAVTYTAYTLIVVPICRKTAVELSGFRLLAVPLAIMSGVVEEAFFRKIVMDSLDSWGYGLVPQFLMSAVLFSAVHFVWTEFARNWRILIPVVGSTFILGIMMSAVYVGSDRIILPAVLAHIAINLVIEPGLLLNAAKESRKTSS